ncbi:FMN-binding protein [Sedimentibacter hydroxybenzoicus DSM 7310]|uniref:FMN-binding protein n=1 Tax=Sedimentibacter hydroxybenzoicus DSM 7310 TaxID=1123245 RepID=A0A974GVH1_SEDHY|nr:FMN-binding protein [Sedimentibacter hydroxybenzoicus]NYB73329.1 FMN-binding protein [Sedimentibacter hydroxybenzoicus DSM 7310]
MKNSLYYPILFMIAVTVVFIAILASINYMLTDTIAFNQESELRQKILYIFDVLPENDDPQEIKRAFDEKIKQKTINDIEVYTLIENNQEAAYAVPINGPGLWGSINAYIGLNKDFTKIIGIEFITQSETPGLGGRISEDIYKNQFRNIDIEGAADGNYIISSPQPGSNVDAIAGATQTSSAVVKMINEDLNTFFESTGVR